MNARELRQAAERIVVATDAYAAWGMAPGVSREVELMARYILATVRDDDDEPVTREWFEEVIGDPLDLQTIEPWFIWWHSTRGLLMGPEGGSVGPEPLALPIKTRGQFRAFCKGLGIELKEKV